MCSVYNPLDDGKINTEKKIPIPFGIMREQKWGIFVGGVTLLSGCFSWEVGNLLEFTFVIITTKHYFF